MLILTRRPSETVYIGEQITITVLGVVGNQVRFGIEAPRDIVIDRAEIHERKKQQRQAAAQDDQDLCPHCKMNPHHPNCKDAPDPNSKQAT